MKKILTIALTLCLLVTALAGCGSSAPAAPDPTAAPTEAPAEATAEPAAEGGKLIVGFDAEFPPFGYIAEDGSYDGFDLALAQEVCARLGWEYEAVAIDWASKDAELKAGNINCIWNGFTCTGREEEYTWSDPYIDNSIVAIVRADSGIESLADLAGKTVMVQSASSGLDALTANEELTASFGELVQLPDYNTGFLELRQGTVDAVVVDVGVGKYQIANTEGDYVILSEPVSVEQYAIGFYLGNEALRDAVNEQLLAMAEDGTMMSIAEKYVDELKRMNDFCNKTVAEMLAYHKEVTDARAYYLDTPASELDAFAFVTEACPALRGEFCKVTLLTDTYFIGFRTAAVKVAEKAIAEVLKNKDNYSSEELEAICNEIDELCSLTDETVIEGYQELQDILFDLM